MCFVPQKRALSRHRMGIESSKVVRTPSVLTYSLPHVPRATIACTFSTSQLPKVVRTSSAFNIFTSKCASRRSGLHFFDISTSKSGPNLRCFVHFHFHMCFAPQRRAIFHLSSGRLAPHLPLLHLLSSDFLHL